MDAGRTSEELDAEQQDERSSRSTPTRSSADLTRSQSAGKGGCWYVLALIFSLPAGLTYHPALHIGHVA